MKKAKLHTICEIIILILCLLLSAGVNIFFPACGPKDDGSYMNCHNAQMAVSIAGAILLLLEVFSALCSRKKLALLLQALMIPGAILTMLLPQTIIHLCMMPDMQCRAVMRPAVLVIGALILVFSIIRTAMLAVGGKKA